MPTKLGAIVGAARAKLLAPKVATATVPADLYWEDGELLDIIVKGCRDLWRGLIDLHQEHFVVIDETNVSIAASAGVLLGVPPDMFRVLLIEPRVTNSTSSTNLMFFKPADYNSPEFIRARSWDAVDPTAGGLVYYAILNAGSPVAPPVIKIAPTLTSAMNLRLEYINTLPPLTLDSDNPIPSESDFALEAWTIAYAKAKDREDRSPDPNWLAIYSTEKASILGVSAPRQEQEPRVIRGVFDEDYGPGLSGSGW